MRRAIISDTSCLILLDKIGTLGVLIDAKLSGFLKSVKPSLEKIKDTNFRLTDDLENRTLMKAGEL